MWKCGIVSGESVRLLYLVRLRANDEVYKVTSDAATRAMR